MRKRKGVHKGPGNRIPDWLLRPHLPSVGRECLVGQRDKGRVEPAGSLVVGCSFQQGQGIEVGRDLG